MEDNSLRVLTLDGGGSKGVYTLGVLYELELKIGKPLHEYFDLIYGTSTGSIIAALLALGYSVESIIELYISLIPKIMSGKNAKEKSKQLKNVADRVFGEKKFDAFKTNIGIVSLNYETQTPLVFKNNDKLAHGMKHSFLPGFGCTISDAVQCSCSAFPIFDIKKVKTKNKGDLSAIDGGFIANNPVFFALIDANKAFGKNYDEIKLVSIGTGVFVEKALGFWQKILKNTNLVKFVERIIKANTETGVVLSTLLFPEYRIVRINETFNQPEYGTNMIEKDVEKLNKLLYLGKKTFSKYEKELEKYLEI